MRGLFVPLKVPGASLSLVSRDPTLPVASDPSLPSLYVPALLVKAGALGNTRDVVLVGDQLAGFLGLFGRGLEPPLSLLCSAISG